MLGAKGFLDARDLAYAASHGDPISLEMLDEAARAVGGMLAGS